MNPSAASLGSAFSGIFKYISCYYESYQDVRFRTMKKAFKYISCYYESEKCKEIIVNYFKFKYISCYYESSFLTSVLFSNTI